MKVDIKTNENGGMTAFLDGRLDTTSVPMCEKDMALVFNNADKEIIIDCTKLEYISSSGLRLFLSLRKNVEDKNSKLTLVHVNDSILNVFKITGFAQLFDIQK